MTKVHDKQTATILAISGRRVTVDANGATADYQINRTAKITLNDKKATLADLENGDEVELGGVSPKGVDQVRATRDPNQPLPKSITPNTTDHFPPTKNDESVALKTKGDEEKATQELRDAANVKAPTPEPKQRTEHDKADEPYLPTGDKSTDDSDITKSSTPKHAVNPVPHTRKRT